MSTDRRTGRDEFYVNYFPLPAGLKRFLRLVAPAMLSLVALVASGVALQMRYPGTGTWNDAEVTLEGVLLDDPWPVLRVAQSDGSTQSVILVDYGKIGADRAVRQSGAAGGRARVTGTIIEREGRRVLELAPRPGVIEAVGAAPAGGAASGRNPDVLGEVSVEGEIVDPKCYLGAMRPGQGEVHRSCARVCIAGGIPAGLIAPGADGAERFLLLLDQGGHPLGARALEWVGRPVRIRGLLERWGDLDVLRIRGDAIEAL